MFERFTERARDVLARANGIAQEERSPAIRRHHLLIALVDSAREGSRSVATVLADAGTDAGELHGALIESLRASETAGVAAQSSPAFTREAKKTLELSLREALSLGHNYIGREHLLLGILREADGPLRAVTDAAGLKYDRARDIVSQESPPSVSGRGRGRGRPLIRGPLGRKSSPAMNTALRRAFDRAKDRNATTGDLLIALLETPGTHFAAALAGVTLPDLTSVTAQVDRLIATRTPDGTEDAVKVDSSGTVTINDPRIADAVKKLVGDNATPERINEILRRLED